MSASLALQTKIKEILQANSTLEGLWGSEPVIYDHVPDEAAFPYIFYESGEGLEWDTSTEDGWDVRPRIHVFHEQESSLFVREVSGTIENILHNNAPLLLTGYRVVLLRRESFQCIREPDGQVWHSLSSFRALIEEN